jgi:hypothetical protein
MQIVSEFYFSIVPEWLIESKISDNAFRVYATLYRFSDKEDGSCYPSMATIGKKCGKSVSSVKRGIKELETIGAITIKHRFNKETGEQTSNLYTLKLNPAFKNELEPIVKSELGASSNMSYKPKSFNHSQSMSVDKSGRNPIFKALIEAVGYEPKTKTEISGFYKVAKSINQAGGTVEDVINRVNIYKTKWKDIEFSIYALEKHWTKLGEMYQENKPPEKYDCNLKGHAWIDLDVIDYCRFCKEERSKVKSSD